MSSAASPLLHSGRRCRRAPQGVVALDRLCLACVRRAGWPADRRPWTVLVSKRTTSSVSMPAARSSSTFRETALLPRQSRDGEARFPGSALPRPMPIRPIESWP